MEGRFAIAKRSAGVGIVLALLASLVSVSLPSRAQAQVQAGRPQMGVAFHAMWSDYTDAQRSAAIQRFADAGIEWVRIDLGWSSFQEQGRDRYSQWYFDRADRVINELNSHGIKVMGMLWATPGWANGGRPREVPPTDPADYGAIARKVADHFRGRVDAWEVWNEPNDGFFQGTAGQYVALLKAAYPQFKAGDPGAEVVLGGPTHNDTEWLRKVYENGAKGSFDIMATHPYQGMGDDPPEVVVKGAVWTMTHVKAVHDLMVEFGDGHKEIWFTEFGWSSHSNWDGISNWQRGVTEAQQADYLMRTIDLMARDYPYVTNMFWYNDRNRDSSDVNLNHYGLMYRDLTPKPVYLRLQERLTSEDPVAPAPSPSAPAPSAPEPAPSPTDATSSPLPADEDAIQEPVDLPDPAPRANLLSNGDFESGLKPWVTRRGRARLVARSHNGTSATKVRSRGRVRSLVSEAVTVEAPGQVEASGYVRVGKRGQRVKLVLIEKRDGEIVTRWRIGLTVRSDGWVEIPTLRYGTEGDTDVKVKLKMRSRKSRVFWADDLYVRKI